MLFLLPHFLLYSSCTCVYKCTQPYINALYSLFWMMKMFRCHGSSCCAVRPVLRGDVVPFVWSWLWHRSFVLMLRWQSDVWSGHFKYDIKTQVHIMDFCSNWHYNTVKFILFPCLRVWHLQDLGKFQSLKGFLRFTSRRLCLMTHFSSTFLI